MSRTQQGQSSHGVAYYRCRFPQEYALANAIDHPRNVIMREDIMIGPLDAWLAGGRWVDQLVFCCQMVSRLSPLTYGVPLNVLLTSRPVAGELSLSQYTNGTPSRLPVIRVPLMPCAW
jgi:hypothetical protein